MSNIMERLDIKIAMENYDKVKFTLKKGGYIELHPIIVKDHTLYDSYLQVLELDKDRTNDIEVIEMSYLRFLAERVFSIPKVGEIYYLNFLKLISLVTSYERNRINIDYHKSKPFLCFYDKEQTLTHMMSQKEFDDFCRIMFHQNDPNYDDLEYSEDMKEQIQIYHRTTKGEGYTPPIDKQKAYVTTKTGIVSKELNQMSYNEFNKVFKMCTKNDLFHATKILQASEKYKIEDGMKLPVYTKDETIMDVLFSGITSDQLQRKIENLV